MTPEARDMTRLRDAYAGLGPNGRRILVRHAERLLAGHQRYGDFPAGRNMKRETIEELVDAAIYLERWVDEQPEPGGAA